ncbi:AAA family ATPase [Actinoplanes sp. NPDC026619]|uniref:AAA family ATPase n=1 Tax=Actinoplanes sp. NPDC026619 TaxID=3155798 RepID=UPI003408E5BC
MSAQRPCVRCRTKLGPGIKSKYCTGCDAAIEALLHHPPLVYGSFWEHPDIRAAASGRHMGRLIAAYRHHPMHGIPIPQEIVGLWANKSQAQISRYENGSPDGRLDRLTYWARLLGIPNWLLWFALPQTDPPEQDLHILPPSGVADGGVLAPLLAYTSLAGITMDDEGNAGLLQQRVEAAHRARSAHGAEATVVVIGGYAGCGKNELGEVLAGLTGWTLLDKDLLTRPLVESLLSALAADPNDRHSAVYLQHVRPVEYRCLQSTVLAQLNLGLSCIVTAPFLRELPQRRWLARLQSSCAARGVDLVPVWVDADPDSMYEYLVRRDAARDGWKLGHWDQYAATIDLDLRPAIPYVLVNNAQHAATGLAAQANRLGQLLSHT